MYFQTHKSVLIHINNRLIYLMEQRILNFFIDYRGHHRKGISIYNATEGSLQQ